MGILKTVATVAVASAVHGEIQRRQQARWARADQTGAAADSTLPAAAPIAAASSTDTGQRLSQLTQLGDLLKSGVLTEAEFQQQKAHILHG